MHMFTNYVLMFNLFPLFWIERSELMMWIFMFWYKLSNNFFNHIFLITQTKELEALFGRSTAQTSKIQKLQSAVCFYCLLKCLRALFVPLSMLFPIVVVARCLFCVTLNEEVMNRLHNYPLNNIHNSLQGYIIC